MFTLSFIESLLEFNPEYIWTFKGGSYSIVNVFTFGYLASALVTVPASKVFRHEGRAMCFGLFLTSLGLCLFSRSIYSYFPIFFANYTTVEITALLTIGFGVGFTFSIFYLVPSYSRIIKTANRHYCIEKTEDLMSQVSITSCISVCIGRMIGTVAGIFIGNFINIDTGVLVLAILINLAMIVYAFLTDVFNLFNEGLIDKLNDIEIIDLGAIYENELN